MDTQDIVNKVNEMAIEQTATFQINGRDCTPKIISLDFLKEGFSLEYMNEETGEYELRPNYGMLATYGDVEFKREFLGVISAVILSEHSDLIPSMLFGEITSDWKREAKAGIMEKLAKEEG